MAVFLRRCERSVRERRLADPTFPPPSRVIGRTPVWLSAHLEAWVAGQV